MPLLIPEADALFSFALEAVRKVGLTSRGASGSFQQPFVTGFSMAISFR